MDQWSQNRAARVARSCIAAGALIALAGAGCASSDGGGGMGATLVYSQRFFESPVVFAYILVMLGIGLALDAVMTALQRRWLVWAG